MAKGKDKGKSQDLFDALRKLDRKKGESDLDYRRRLKTSLDAESKRIDAPQQQANLCRVQLGLALLAERPDTGQLKWAKEQAKLLGYVGTGARAIRELIAVAEAAEAAKTRNDGVARIVPLEIVQRPWAQVRRTLRVFKETNRVMGNLPGKPWTPERALATLDKAMRRARKLVPAPELVAWLEQNLAPQVPPAAQAQAPAARAAKKATKPANKLATDPVIPPGMAPGKSRSIAPKGKAQVEALTAPLQDAERNGHVTISNPDGADPEDGCGDGSNAGRGPPPRIEGERAMLTVTNNLSTHLVIPRATATGKALMLTPKGTAQVEALTGPLRDAERKGHVTISDPGGTREPEDDGVREVPAAGRTGRPGPKPRGKAA